MQSLVIPLLSAMMLLQYFVWGSWYVSASAYLEKVVHFSGTDVGWTYTVGPLAGILSPFFVGMIADRFFSTERILGVLHLAGAALMYVATQMMMGGHASPAAINFVLFLHMLCYFPTLALTNSISMYNLKSSEKSFPFVRSFGTVGWILAGVLISYLNWDDAAQPERLIHTFEMAAITGAAMGVFCFFLPHTPPPLAGQKVSAREILGVDAFALLRDRSFLTFMLCCFLICIPLAYYYQLAFRCLDDLKIEAPGRKMTYGQMSEVFFLLVMPFLLTRLGFKKTLLIGMLAWVVRYALFAYAAPLKLEWALLAAVVLHGICYDFFFVTGQIYTDKVAPASIRAQAQGMLVFFTLGWGLLIGGQVAGNAKERYTTTTDAITTVDWRTLWTGPAIAAAVVLVIFALLFREQKSIDRSTDSR